MVEAQRRELLTAPTREHIVVALELVDRREQADLARFTEGTVTTSQVMEMVATIGDRRSVDARRRRGKLIGLRSGRDTRHPDWQLCGGDTRLRLGEVIPQLLAAAAGDVVLADAIMREPRGELDGASLVDLYDQGRADEIIAFVRTRTEGFVP